MILIKREEESSDSCTSERSIKLLKNLGRWGKGRSSSQPLRGPNNGAHVAVGIKCSLLPRLYTSGSATGGGACIIQ